VLSRRRIQNTLLVPVQLITKLTRLKKYYKTFFREKLIKKERKIKRETNKATTEKKYIKKRKKGKKKIKNEDKAARCTEKSRKS
jgi:hypothetical protein